MQLSAIESGVFENTWNKVKEFGQMAFRTIKDLTNSAYTYCKDTVIPKICELWKDTILPALKSAFESIKPAIKKAIEWVKSPLGTSTVMMGAGFAAVQAAQRQPTLVRQAFLNTVGATAFVVGAYKLSQLV